VGSTGKGFAWARRVDLPELSRPMRRIEIILWEGKEREEGRSGVEAAYRFKRFTVMANLYADLLIKQGEL
jgi:hypothetical protein